MCYSDTTLRVRFSYFIFSLIYWCSHVPRAIFFSSIFPPHFQLCILDSDAVSNNSPNDRAVPSSRAVFKYPRLPFLSRKRTHQWPSHLFFAVKFFSFAKKITDLGIRPFRSFSGFTYIYTFTLHLLGIFFLQSPRRSNYLIWTMRRDVFIFRKHELFIKKYKFPINIPFPLSAHKIPGDEND